LPRGCRTATRFLSPKKEDGNVRTTRSHKRSASTALEEFFEERMLQNEEDRSNIIDFEQILNDSQIIPLNIKK
jgi:hypothetical protein